MWKYKLRKITVQEDVEICGPGDLVFLNAVMIFWVQQMTGNILRT